MLQFTQIKATFFCVGLTSFFKVCPIAWTTDDIKKKENEHEVIIVVVVVMMVTMVMVVVAALKANG